MNIDPVSTGIPGQPRPLPSTHTQDTRRRKKAKITGCGGMWRDEVWGRGPQPSFYYKSFPSSLRENWRPEFL